MAVPVQGKDTVIRTLRYSTCGHSHEEGDASTLYNAVVDFPIVDVFIPKDSEDEEPRQPTS